MIVITPLFTCKILARLNVHCLLKAGLLLKMKILFYKFECCAGDVKQKITKLEVLLYCILEK